ncbi:uncharacterized protein LOC128922138 [Zeugodacus cucurbitae]|uniref:uncharacterized protein LOC128922138 n=1 Tax=Zeugodacus cucurbitae TaxID=28588 RepID=UPI0023D9138C|nr:uncharacterized protein LOC128922138 [Zeugodacus cucurbitae]
MDSFGKRGLWAKVQKLYNIHPERNQQDDLTVVGVKGVKDELILLASCYMPHDSEAPTAELHRLAVTSSDRRQALVVGADANAHHTIWGSPDINQRGESLFNVIIQSSLAIANRGEEPTYIGPTSKNVLDITLYTSRGVVMENWKVLGTPSFSDHRYIYFSIRSKAKIRSVGRRDPRRMLPILQSDQSFHKEQSGKTDP